MEDLNNEFEGIEIPVADEFEGIEIPVADEFEGIEIPVADEVNDKVNLVGISPTLLEQAEYNFYANGEYTDTSEDFRIGMLQSHYESQSDQTNPIDYSDINNLKERMQMDIGITDINAGFDKLVSIGSSSADEYKRQAGFKDTMKTGAQAFEEAGKAMGKSLVAAAAEDYIVVKGYDKMPQWQKSLMYSGLINSGTQILSEEPSEKYWKGFADLNEDINAGKYLDFLPEHFKESYDRVQEDLSQEGIGILEMGAKGLMANLPNLVAARINPMLGLATMYSVEADSMLQQLVDVGISYKMALKYSKIYGVTSGSIEYIENVGKLKGALIGNTKKKLKKGLLQNMINSLGQGVGNIAEELSQAGIELKVYNAAVAEHNEANPNNLLKTKDSIEWKQTIKGSAGMSIVLDSLGLGKMVSTKKGRAQISRAIEIDQMKVKKREILKGLGLSPLELSVVEEQFDKIDTIEEYNKFHDLLANKLEDVSTQDDIVIKGSLNNKLITQALSLGNISIEDVVAITSIIKNDPAFSDNKDYIDFTNALLAADDDTTAETELSKLPADKVAAVVELAQVIASKQGAEVVDGEVIASVKDFYEKQRAQEIRTFGEAADVKNQLIEAKQNYQTKKVELAQTNRKIKKKTKHLVNTEDLSKKNRTNSSNKSYSVNQLIKAFLAQADNYFGTTGDTVKPGDGSAQRNIAMEIANSLQQGKITGEVEILFELLEEFENDWDGSRPKHSKAIDTGNPLLQIFATAYNQNGEMDLSTIGDDVKELATDVEDRYTKFANEDVKTYTQALESYYGLGEVVEGDELFIAESILETTMTDSNFDELGTPENDARLAGTINEKNPAFNLDKILEIVEIFSPGSAQLLSDAVQNKKGARDQWNLEVKENRLIENIDTQGFEALNPEQLEVLHYLLNREIVDAQPDADLQKIDKAAFNESLDEYLEAHADEAKKQSIEALADYAQSFRPVSLAETLRQQALETFGIEEDESLTAAERDEMDRQRLATSKERKEVSKQRLLHHFFPSGRSVHNVLLGWSSVGAALKKITPAAKRIMDRQTILIARYNNELFTNEDGVDNGMADDLVNLRHIDILIRRGLRSLGKKSGSSLSQENYTKALLEFYNDGDITKLAEVFADVYEFIKNSDNDAKGVNGLKSSDVKILKNIFEKMFGTEQEGTVDVKAKLATISKTLKKVYRNMNMAKAPVKPKEFKSPKPVKVIKDGKIVNEAKYNDQVNDYNIKKAKNEARMEKYNNLKKLYDAKLDRIIPKIIFRRSEVWKGKIMDKRKLAKDTNDIVAEVRIVEDDLQYFDSIFHNIDMAFRSYSMVMANRDLFNRTENTVTDADTVNDMKGAADITEEEFHAIFGEEISNLNNDAKEYAKRSIKENFTHKNVQADEELSNAYKIFRGMTIGMIGKVSSAIKQLGDIVKNIYELSKIIGPVAAVPLYVKHFDQIMGDAFTITKLEKLRKNVRTALGINQEYDVNIRDIGADIVDIDLPQMDMNERFFAMAQAQFEEMRYKGRDAETKMGYHGAKVVSFWQDVNTVLIRTTDLAMKQIWLQSSMEALQRLDNNAVRVSKLAGMLNGDWEMAERVSDEIMHSKEGNGKLSDDHRLALFSMMNQLHPLTCLDKAPLYKKFPAIGVFKSFAAKKTSIMWEWLFNPAMEVKEYERVGNKLAVISSKSRDELIKAQKRFNEAGINQADKIVRKETLDKAQAEHDKNIKQLNYAAKRTGGASFNMIDGLQRYIAFQLLPDVIIASLVREIKYMFRGEVPDWEEEELSTRMIEESWGSLLDEGMPIVNLGRLLQLKRGKGFGASVFTEAFKIITPFELEGAALERVIFDDDKDTFEKIKALSAESSKLVPLIGSDVLKPLTERYDWNED